MSNTANLLADLDGFYRGSDNGPTKTQQAQAPHITQPQPQAQPQSSSDPFGLGLVAQGSQGAPAETGANLADDDDDDWGGFETAEPAAPQGLSAPKPFNVAPVTSPVPALSDPFEGFTAANPTPTPPTGVHTSLPRPPPSGQEQPPFIKNRPTRVPTMQLVTNSLLDLDASPQVSTDAAPRKPDVPLQKSPRKPPRKTVQRDPNVLFDADDVDEEEEDDEFGDFEDVDSWTSPPTGNPAPPSKPTTQPASVDLLSMDDPLPAPQPSTLGASKSSGSLLMDTNTMSAPAHASAQPPSPFKQRNPFPDLAVSTSQTKDVKDTKDPPGGPSPATPWPEFEDGGPAGASSKDEWPSIDGSRPGKPRKAAQASAAKAEMVEEPDNWDWDAVEAPDAAAEPPLPLSTRDDYDDKEPPPTNIPPPSVLMTILPELFSLANTSLLKPTAGHSATARKELLSNPSTIAFLRAYLLIATVAARILAGRKLRWNRDRFLAQGMAISAAGAKGMKLAGVDKAEAGREDREAADVVAAWREQVGRVRAAVAGANGAISEGGGPALRVPEVGESMRVNTAKAAPRAPRQCVVCGLKREERVAKVDFDVEDSFGEWWVEHWGHRTCRNFWKEHEGRLRQR